MYNLSTTKAQALIRTGKLSFDQMFEILKESQAKDVITYEIICV